ncbi:MAG TPA: toast rack family protein [Methanospirillum sp.]|nr:toast rack family protein [Methanospirillum sp.]
MIGSVSLPSLKTVIMWLFVLTVLFFGIGWGITLIDSDQHTRTSYEKHIPLRVSADGIEQSALSLIIESGTLNLSCGIPGDLISGDIQTSVNRNGPVQAHEIKNGSSIFSLTQEKPGVGNLFVDDDRWNLGIDPTIPVSLDIRSGTGDVRIDSGPLNLTFLGVRSGAGDVFIDLTRCHARHLPVTIEAGLGDTILLLPEHSTIAADTEVGLGDAEVSGLEGSDGKYYYGSQSPDDPVISLSVKSGIGDLSIRRGL